MMLPRVPRPLRRPWAKLGALALSMRQLLGEETTQERQRRQEDEGLEAGYAAALCATRLIRRDFPELYARQVHWRRLGPPVAYALLELWLNLVEHHWLEMYPMDGFELAARPGQIEPIFARRCATLTADAARSAFIEDGAPVRCFYAPLWVTYGLGRGWEAVEATTPDQGATVATIWHLVQGTAWAVHSIAEETGEEDWLASLLDGWQPPTSGPAPARLTQRQARRLNALRLPADTDMPVLTAALDEAPLPGDASIGALLRVVCAQTGNHFLDYAIDEIIDDHGGFEEVEWDDLATLTQGRQMQREARRACDRIVAYLETVAARPHLLLTLAGTIVRTATRLTGRATRPRTLVDIFREGDTDAGEHEAGAALAGEPDDSA